MSFYCRKCVPRICGSCWYTKCIDCKKNPNRFDIPTLDSCPHVKDGLYKDSKGNLTTEKQCNSCGVDFTTRIDSVHFEMKS